MGRADRSCACVCVYVCAPHVHGHEHLSIKGNHLWSTSRWRSLISSSYRWGIDEVRLGIYIFIDLFVCLVVFFIYLPTYIFIGFISHTYDIHSFIYCFLLIYCRLLFVFSYRYIFFSFFYTFLVLVYLLLLLFIILLFIILLLLSYLVWVVVHV